MTTKYMVMNNKKVTKLGILFLLMIIFCRTPEILGQGIQGALNIQQKKVDLGLVDSNIYSPDIPPTLRILYDYYHHKLPDEKIGELNIVTGGWENNSGRYAWNDFVHGDSYDPVFIALSHQYSIRILLQPYTDSILARTDAVIITNPDYPENIPDAKVISDAEIAALRQFVKNGGSLMVNINSPEINSESFEQVQMRKLMSGFGLGWNDNFTHGSTIKIGNQHPYFYNISTFHYGGGCTLKILPNAQDPKVLLTVYADSTYSDTHVRGPGIVMVRYGRGKVILVGDSGSWGLTRPWDQNIKLLKQLIYYLKPDQGVKPPNLIVGGHWAYKEEVIQVQALQTLDSAVTKIKQPKYKVFRPRRITEMPYLKATANLELTANKKTAQDATELTAKVKDFQWFDKKVSDDMNPEINFIASRQGNISHIGSNGFSARWLAPTITNVIGLIPVDGIRIGDQWEYTEPIRIPIFHATDLAPVMPVKMNYEYVGNVKVGNHQCRLFRASGSISLKKLKISIEDILPQYEVRQVGGATLKFYNPTNPGMFMYKREKWVDEKTGIVVQARTQAHIKAWIHASDGPIYKTNDLMDVHTIVKIANITTLSLDE